MKKLRIYFPFVFILFTIFLNAQTTREEFFSDSRNAGGIFHPYTYDDQEYTTAPEGYKPFYIANYARHGSRWVTGENCHNVPLKVLGEAYKAGKLTDLGKSLYERIQIAAEDAADHYGDLAPMGIEEHKQIAERMFRLYPEIFSTDNGRRCFLNCRSTVVPRCILSMAANNERLKELNPEIETFREATRRNKYLNNHADRNKDTVKVIVRKFLEDNFNPDRFNVSIFSDKSYVKENVEDPIDLAVNVFSAAMNMMNLDYLDLSFDEVFTEDETFVLWQASNLSMYMSVGPSAVNGKVALESASLLLKDIIDCADSAIKNKNVSADFRFGHDTYIVPLLALMDIEGMNVQEADPEKVYQVWSNFKVTPMGTNVQLVFYHNDTDDVLVKVLHCEKEVKVPVETDLFPYYHWKDLKAYYENKI